MKTKAASAEKFQELEVAAEEKADMKIRQKDSDLAEF